PLDTQGDHADRIVALARQFDNDRIVAVVPRLTNQFLTPTQLLPIGAEVWQSTWLELPSGWGESSFRNVLTGECLHSAMRGDQVGFLVADALRTCPVALLMHQSS